MGDELIDILDEKGNLTGKQKMKSEAHHDGSWHRSAHIWIYNSKGEILLQLRAKNKDVYPDMWDSSVAGHVSAGEEPVTSGVREIQEEVGLSVQENDLEFYKIEPEETRYKEITSNEFIYIYLLKYDGNASTIKIQEEELQEARFIPLEEIEEGLRSNPERYCPHTPEYWAEMFIAIRNKTKQ